LELKKADEDGTHGRNLVDPVNPSMLKYPTETLKDFGDANGYNDKP